MWNHNIESLLLIDLMLPKASSKYYITDLSGIYIKTKNFRALKTFSYIPTYNY